MHDHGAKLQGSTLAEITSEHIWNLYLNFVNEIGLNITNIILNADGRALPAWQWTTGESFSDVDSYQLGFDSEMYGRLSKTGNQNVLSQKVCQTVDMSVVMVMYVNIREIGVAKLLKVLIIPFLSMEIVTSSTMTRESAGLKRTMNVIKTMEGWLHSRILKRRRRVLLHN